MKIKQKIGLGLSVFFIFLLGYLHFGIAKAASVPDKDDAIKCVQTMKFTDFAHIQCDTVSNGKINFLDRNPTDSNTQFRTYEDGFFCDDSQWYIRLHSTHKSLDDVGKPAGGVFGGKYITGTGCDEYVSVDNAPIKGTSSLAILKSGGTNSVVNLDGVDDGILSKYEYQRLQHGAYDPSNDRVLFYSGDFNANTTDCGGHVLAVDKDSTNAKDYEIKSGGGYGAAHGDLGNLPDKGCGIGDVNYGLGKDRGFRVFPNIKDLEVSLIGKKCQPDDTDPDGYKCHCIRDESGGLDCRLIADDSFSANGDNAAPTCESNFDSGFEWVFCPALRLADDAAGVFNSFIQDQLCLNTGGSTSPGNTKCNGKNIFGTSDGVKNAWRDFKNIASVLLVIVMLIMVISQAISAGPFDAYTVRKMLPRIVAAIILVQLSWIVTKFAIDVSNDLGTGIADFIAGPFGGMDKISDLDKLVGASFATHTTGTNDTFAFFAVLAAGVGLLALSLPGLILLALYVVLALFTAFVTLIFRKLFVITLVIFAPVAFILWVLPGTERYWKMWYDNFLRLLLMFPIIMGLIAAGRIFAYITAGSPNISLAAPHLAIAHAGPVPVPYFADVSDFITLVIIVLAYFGPYFLLPMTFKWGGALMEVTGKGVKAGIDKASHPASEYLKWRKDLSPWKQAREARKAEVTRRAKLGFYEGLGNQGLRGRYRRARLGGANVLIPNIRESIRQRELVSQDRDIRQAIVENATEAARNDTFKLEQNRLSQRVAGLSEGERQDEVRRIIRRDSGATEAQRHAALVQALQDRDYATVESYMSDTAEELHAATASGDQRRIQRARQRQEEATRFRNQNAQALSVHIPHVLKGDIDQDGLHQGIMRAADGSERDIAQMHGEAVQSILSHLSEQAAHGATAAVQAAAAERLQKFMRTFAAAIENQDTRGLITPGGAQAVQQFLDPAVAVPNYAAGRQQAEQGYHPGVTPGTHIDIQPETAVKNNFAATAAAAPAGDPLHTLRTRIRTDGSIVT